MSDESDTWTEENLEEDSIKDQINNFKWGQFTPPTEELKPVEKFDLKLLPENLRPWINDVSHRMQCPPDYPAVTIMVALSSLIGRKVGIHPKQKDDWRVIPNLWGVIIGRPSAKKSPALSEALKPIEKLEMDAREKFNKDKTQHDIDTDLFELLKKDFKDKAREAVKEGNDEKATKFLTEAENKKPDLLTRKRYKVNDTSVEKLGELLSENSNGLLVVRDELNGWLKSLNKYEHSNDKQFYLEAFNGTGSYTYDRIGRGTITIEATTISIIGGIQPSVLLPLIRESIHGGANDDGLIQRLQLAVYPDSSAFKYVDEYPDKNAKIRAYNLFQRIDEMPPKQTEDKFSDIACLKFTPEAQQIFTDWFIELEKKLNSGDLHPALESHFAKYRSLIPSLALVLELADNPNAEDISKQSIIRACAWGVYLESHANRIYSLAINNEVRNANTILAKIKNGKLSTPFEIRDVIRPQWSGLTSKEDVHSAIDYLIGEGYLNTVEIPNGSRIKTIYYAHPEIMGGSCE